jgi:ABC-type phosphate/phosphonate transport system permease subunit
MIWVKKKRRTVMKTKTLILISLLVMFVYIAYLKVAGLNDLDFNNLFESIRPLIPHSMALIGAFVFNILAYLKGKMLVVVMGALLSLVSAISYYPTSLLMLIPTAILVYATIKLAKEG